MAENNIDKRIDAVVGEALEDAIENETPIDIEIVSEETTVSTEPLDVDQDFYDNLADNMEDDQLNRLSSQLIEDYENDKSSRDDWSRSYTRGLDLLGFKYEERSKPFQGASSVNHPLLAEAVTQFSATAYKEMMPSDGPVRTRIMGKETQEKYEQSQRVKEFMNYQITTVMEEYTPELDQMLFYLPLSGSTFKKVYYDAQLERAVSKFIPAEDLVVPYTASDLDSCERITHVVKQSENDIRKKQAAGFYSDIALSTPSPEDATYSSNDVKDKINQLDGVQPTGESYDYTLLEIHVDLDLDEFNDTVDDSEKRIKVPYIVTIDEQSRKVLSIRRNYDEDDETKKKKQYFVHYKFLPGLGFYGFGLIHLIGGLTRTATQALRQLIDAGTLSNLPAGFKARGLRIRDDDSPLQPGEFRDVDAPGGAIRDGLMPLPYKEPSQTLFALLGFVVQAGQRFASIADMQVGDGNQNAPVGTTIALLERGSKIMSAIHKRCYYSQRKEFKLLYKVFADYLPETYPYSVEGADRTIKAEDFDGSLDVLPVADPNIFSTAQRVTLAQTELQLAQSAPDLHNMKEAYRRMYEALGIKDVDEILRKDTPVAPKDPATEHADLLDGNLMRAYEGQDHDAHIQNHLLFGTNQMILSNPPMAMKLQKHILEHVSLKAKEQTAFLVSQGQVQEDQMDQVIARLEAQFMGELKQLSQQLSGGGQPDPAIQLKQQELQQDAMKDQMDSQRDQARIQLDAEKLRQKTAIDQARIKKDYDIADKRAEVQYDKMTTQNLNMRNKNASK